MSTKSKNRGIKAVLLLAVAIVLACGVTTIEPTAAPNFEATKAALQMQGTAMSLQLTQSVVGTEAQSQLQQQSQSTQAPPPTAQPAATAGIVPTATQDVEARIKSAKILVYENTDERGIGMWVQDAIDGMGLTATNVGSYSGHFMENIDSGVKYDLIIVDTEDKDIITGEFWDVINTRLGRDKVALIVEIWYLQNEANGPINKILGGCGIEYRKSFPLDDSIYWWVPDHPIFNEPNTVLPLIHYNRYWANGAGDKMLQSGGGDATMLAGLSARPSTGEGVLATCYQGRVIFATYSDHDYSQSDIVPLWQNFIHYTLKNHFAVTP